MNIDVAGVLPLTAENFIGQSVAVLGIRSLLTRGAWIETLTAIPHNPGETVCEGCFGRAGGLVWLAVFTENGRM